MDSHKFLENACVERSAELSRRSVQSQLAYIVSIQAANL